MVLIRRKFYQTTDFTVMSTNFEWILQKCDLIFVKDNISKSDDFSLTNREEVKCSASLHIDALKFHSYNYSLLNVTISPSNYDIAKLLIKVKIKDASDESNSFTPETQSININGPESTDVINLKFELPGQYHYHETARSKTLKSLASNNTLTIVIEIQDVEEFCKINELSVETDHKMKLTTEMFATLYKNHELFDVTFIVGENDCRMKAHAVVLAVACPYFSALFNDNMEEGEEHIVDLSEDPDINEEIFEAFLDYIYGIKSVSELKNIARDLLVLADKYNIKELFKSCEIVLCESLMIPNAASLLLFANKYKCKLLKEKALEFTKTCMDIVKFSEQFEEMCKDVELMRELF